MQGPRYWNTRRKREDRIPNDGARVVESFEHVSGSFYLPGEHYLHSSTVPGNLTALFCVLIRLQPHKHDHFPSSTPRHRQSLSVSLGIDCKSGGD